MANEWYAQEMGEEIGPLTYNDLRQMVASGRITPLSHVRKSKSGEWVLARRIRGLFQSMTIGGTAAIAEKQKDSPVESAHTIPPAQVEEDWNLRSAVPSERRTSLRLIGWVVAAIVMVAVIIPIASSHYARKTEVSLPAEPARNVSRPHDEQADQIAKETVRFLRLINMDASIDECEAQFVFIRRLAAGIDDPHNAAISRQLVSRLDDFMATWRMLALLTRNLSHYKKGDMFYQRFVEDREQTKRELISKAQAVGDTIKQMDGLR